MRKSFLLFVIVFITCCSEKTFAQNIYTFAGIDGTNGYTGDDSLATTAEISSPAQLASSSTGIIYFADNVNNVVRMVNTSGIITTFAGTGAAGYSGDGGVATAAKLRGPVGVAVDAAGNVYITDNRNNVVRKVSTTGIISTIAGTSTAGYAGDGGAATAAQLSRPVGIAVDASSNVFIADARNEVVRKINTAGIISTIAGNNTPGYSGDGSPATGAQLFAPQGIAVSTSGNLYIADARNNVIRMVNTSGIISTFAGTGTPGHAGDGGAATAALLYFPYDVKLDGSGNVFIADSSNTVRMINTSNIISGYAGTGVAGYSGDGGPATAAKMTGTVGLAIDPSNNVYISTPGNNVIRRVGAPISGIYITSNKGADTLCIGSVTTFTATPIAATTPHYQWKQNGVNVGTDNPLFTPVSLATGDRISCSLVTTPGGHTLAISNNLRLDSLPRPGTLSGPTTYCVGATVNVMDLGGPPPGPGGGAWVSSNAAVATIAPPGRVTAVSVGSATIYYVVSNVCGSDTASLAITVGPNTIGTISGSADVCAGTTTTYSDATTPGKWRLRPPFTGTLDSTTGVFTAGFVPGTGFIIYGISPACYKTYTITIDSLPINAAISGPTVVDSGSTITLTNLNPGGTWSSSNTTIATIDTTGLVSGLSSGNAVITYTITNAKGCTADTTYHITVVNTTDVHNIPGVSAFRIFPNPAYGSFNISGSNLVNEPVKVAVSDVAGRLVYVSDITLNNSGNASVNISSLKAGVYMLTVTSGSGFYCSKLVVE